ncbi:MAG: hypothetical protein K2Q23_11710 [Bryobacteraceae bacterium]|nr:hypothetical protein [Bryobacteraceae bacterium]
MASDVVEAMGMSGDLRERCSHRQTDSPERCQLDELSSVWDVLSSKIVAGDESAYSEFRILFLPTVRRAVRRMMGARGCEKKVSDCIEDAVTEAYLAIRDGRLRDRQRLPGFVAAVAKSVAYHTSRKYASSRFVQIKPEDERLAADIPGGDEMLWRADQRKLVLDALESLSSAQREIVERFYILGQHPDTIKADLGLSERQFQVEKSRGKQRLIAKCRKYLLHQELVRATGGQALAAAAGRPR